MKSKYERNKEVLEAYAKGRAEQVARRETL